MLKSISSTNLIDKSCSLFFTSSKKEFDCNKIFLKNLVMRAVRTVVKKFLYRDTSACYRPTSENVIQRIQNLLKLCHTQFDVSKVKRFLSTD